MNSKSNVVSVIRRGFAFTATLIAVLVVHAGPPSVKQKIAIDKRFPSQLWTFESTLHENTKANNSLLTRIYAPNGKLMQSVTTPRLHDYAGLKFRDLNGDGLLDVLIETEHGMRLQTFHVLLATPDRGFVPLRLAKMSAKARSAVSPLADRMDDGTERLVVANPEPASPGTLLLHWPDNHGIGHWMCGKIKGVTLTPVVEVYDEPASDHNVTAGVYYNQFGVIWTSKPDNVVRGEPFPTFREDEPSEVVGRRSCAQITRVLR